MVKKQNVIRQHNDIINGNYQGSISELRLFYCYLVKIDWEQVITTDTRFYITVEEYAELCGMSNQNAKTEIEYGLKKMGERWVELANPDPKTGKAVITRWLVSRSRDVEVGDKIMAGFSSEIIPFISQLKETGNFTITRIGQLLKLPSYYAMRLYNIVIENLNMPKTGRTFYLEYTALRKMFGASNKYKTTKDFKRNVLDFSINMITKNSDVIVSYSQRLKGRKIIGFEFYIIPKKEINNPNYENPYSRIYLNYDGAKRLRLKNETGGQFWTRLIDLGFQFDFDIPAEDFNEQLLLLE